MKAGSRIQQDDGTIGAERGNAQRDDGDAGAERGNIQQKERWRSFREQLRNAEKHQASENSEAKHQLESVPASIQGERKEDAWPDEWLQAYRQAADRLIPRMLKRKTLFLCHISKDDRDVSCLAAALAQAGLRMLLVEANILREADDPVAARYHHTGNGQDTCQTEHEGLDIAVLPSVRESLQAYTRLYSLADDLEGWEQRYDGILIQLPASDALAEMPSFLSGRDVLFAVRKGKTRCRALKQAVQRVREAGAAWMGALFLTQ